MTEWLLHSWYELLPQHIAMPVLTVAAAVFGALIGVEREIKEKPAGVRTLALVSLGAAVFTMMSIVMAGDRADPGRIAAQIVTGIGFLGAGAILRSPLGVVGMTTAATIWVAAAIGMVVGAGFVGAGLGLAILTLILLYGVLRLEHIYQGACDFTRASVLYEPHGGKTFIRLQELVDEHRLKGERTESGAQVPGLEEFSFAYCRAHAQHREVLNRLAGMREVREIRTAEAVSAVSGER
jgi:putative Mg2+ transporter-C (MgtC) family protein